MFPPGIRKLQVCELASQLVEGMLLEEVRVVCCVEEIGCVCARVCMCVCVCVRACVCAH